MVFSTYGAPGYSIQISNAPSAQLSDQIRYAAFVASISNLARHCMQLEHVEKPALDSRFATFVS